MSDVAMSLEEKLEKIQESLLALCNAQTTVCEDQKKLAADQKALAVKVDSLSGTVRDIDQQTRAYNLAILRLEKGEHPLCNPSTGKDGNLSSSVQSPLPINKTGSAYIPLRDNLSSPFHDVLECFLHSAFSLENSIF
jgi:hypothetical protein